MANEQLGIVEERQRIAAKYARFIAPPNRIATPAAAPVMSQAVQATVDSLKRENVRLKAHNRALAEQIRVAVGGLAHTQPPAEVRPSIAEVQAAFCRAFNELGGDVGGEPITHAHLVSQRRSRAQAWPRHACILLVRQICGGPSLPKIAKAFGGRDHTSVMHALQKAPERMIEVPLLASVHAKVLADFEAQQK